MTKSSRLYHYLAIILCISLVASLLPRSAWGVNVAYAHEAPVLPGAPAAVRQAVTEGLQDAALPDSLTGLTGGLSSDLFAAAPQAQVDSLASSLSISKVQSTYYPSGLIDNTVLITYTISNNQLPANLPQVAEGATLTGTGGCFGNI